MKNKINQFIVLAAFTFFIVACGSGNKTQNNTTTPSTLHTTYETVVLKSNIPSPRKELKGMIGSSSINVIYGSPSVKDRKVWDGLVPYGKVWRTGANEATSFEIKNDIMVEGKKLAAGKYGLFTIPNEKEWIVIFNKVHDQWGSGAYDEAKDVLRVNVTPKQADDHSETMDFVLDGNALVLKWEKLIVPISISNG